MNKEAVDVLVKQHMEALLASEAVEQRKDGWELSIEKCDKEKMKAAETLLKRIKSLLPYAYADHEYKYEEPGSMVEELKCLEKLGGTEYLEKLAGITSGHPYIYTGRKAFTKTMKTHEQEEVRSIAEEIECLEKELEASIKQEKHQDLRAHLAGKKKDLKVHEANLGKTKAECEKERAKKKAAIIKMEDDKEALLKMFIKKLKNRIRFEQYFCKDLEAGIASTEPEGNVESRLYYNIAIAERIACIKELLWKDKINPYEIEFSALKTTLRAIQEEFKALKEEVWALLKIEETGIMSSRAFCEASLKYIKLQGATAPQEDEPVEEPVVFMSSIEGAPGKLKMIFEAPPESDVIFEDGPEHPWRTIKSIKGKSMRERESK